MGATSTFWLASPLSGNWVMLSWIVEAFAGLQEYRVGKGAKGRPRHPLLGLLMILFLSRVAGCRGGDASADWARAHFEVLRRHLPLWIRPPGADTLRRTAEAYDLDDILAGIEADDEAVHIGGQGGGAATRGGWGVSLRHRRRPGPPFHRGPVPHDGARHERDRGRRRRAGHRG